MSKNNKKRKNNGKTTRKPRSLVKINHDLSIFNNRVFFKKYPDADSSDLEMCFSPKALKTLLETVGMNKYPNCCGVNPRWSIKNIGLAKTYIKKAAKFDETETINNMNSLFNNKVLYLLIAPIIENGTRIDFFTVSDRIVEPINIAIPA